MIIRSQNKTQIIFTENIPGINVKDNYVNKTNGGIPFEATYKNSDIVTNGYWLGRYTSKEKAIKVLDMIQETYITCTDQWNGIPCVTNKVFQMPADNEVIV